MKLNISNRDTSKKSEAKRARREGKIPAALYVHGKDALPINIEAAEYHALLRSIKKGRLATTIITLVDESGKERRAIIKDIQYHVTTYQVLHLDFEELLDDVKVKVKIPIEFKGEMDCVGVKLGGVIRQVIRGCRVQCLPKDLPECFKVNVAELSIGEARKLKDIEMSDSVRPLMDLNEVCVVIAKR